MPISISLPRVAPPLTATLFPETFDSDPEDGDGDISMSPSKRQRTSIVTPGEIVTSDPQWMRGHGTYLLEAPATNETDETNDASIIATVAGTVTKVNKLLSVRPLRARYQPEIGDLVVGRIVEVQSKRWKVDISSLQHSALLLSSINLPGGILRKRTSTDELQIRSFFAEGELLVAEVQSLFADGSASLHTRSLRYGKLRNGYFLAVDAAGIGRGRSQVVTLAAAGGAGEVEVVLGVNGYVWIQKKIALLGEGGKGVSITRLEEEASETMYENRNEEISVQTRREIARIGECIKALVREGVRVDEEMLNAVYEIAVEDEEGEREGQGSLEGGKGRVLVERAVLRRVGA
jgi:exosome complex component RRP4